MAGCPKICGPKLSICGIILGIWGIIMLALMGLFLHLHAPALFEDLPINHTLWLQNATLRSDGSIDMKIAYEKYDQAAVNCFIAAGIYVLIFIFSICQQRVNARASFELQ